MDSVRDLENTVHRAISYHRMFTSATRIAVGLSGIDSYALYRFLLRHHDHKLLTGITILETRSSQREDEVRIWQELAAKSEVTYVVTSFRDEFGAWLDEIVEALEPTSSLSPCLICAQLRNEALRRSAIREGVDTVATGGNANDVLSVMLIRMLGGPLVALDGVVYEHRAAPAYRASTLTYCSPLFYSPKDAVRSYASEDGSTFPSYRCKFLWARGELRLTEVLKPLLELFPEACDLATFDASELLPNPDLRECRVCGEKRRLLPAERCPSCQILALLDEGVA